MRGGMLDGRRLKWVRTMVSPKARKRPTWVGDMVTCASGAHERCHRLILWLSTSLHILIFMFYSHNSLEFPFSRGTLDAIRYDLISATSQCADLSQPGIHCAERPVGP